MGSHTILCSVDWSVAGDDTEETEVKQQRILCSKRQQDALLFDFCFLSVIDRCTESSGNMSDLGHHPPALPACWTRQTKEVRREFFH
jgi:hypothetical protein